MTLFHCNHLAKETSDFLFFIYLWGGESVICEVLVQGSMTEILFCPILLSIKASRWPHHQQPGEGVITNIGVKINFSLMCSSFLYSPVYEYTE